MSLVFLTLSCTKSPSRKNLNTSPAAVEVVTEHDTAADFLAAVNKVLKEKQLTPTLAEWVRATHITDDTTKISSELAGEFSALATNYALASKDYKGTNEDENRQLSLLVHSLTMPSPQDEAENKEMAQIKAELESAYGSGKFCKTPANCKDLQQLEDVMTKSRNPDELLEAWEGWRTVSIPMKAKYQKAVELGNIGAQDLGFKNLADVWKSNYDRSPEDYEKMVDRLWSEVKPFYEQLHCYARSRLNKKYGDKVAPKEGAIPAHLMGNMWSQTWENIEDLMEVDKNSSLNITKLIKDAKYDSKKMVKTAENFFVSLGMPELPKSFYERSLFEKPRDREVVCHASAWPIDMADDVRIKMCIKIDEDDFRTIHHELGHIYYYLAYKNLPYIYQNSANDGFHEALGDTIELSVTQKYLNQINLSKNVNSKQNTESYLLQMALKKIAFLPFGLLVDKWRWKVFEGSVKPEDYNKAWWDLVKNYQGLVPPRERPAEAFDPGAKYHVPAFTPYSRYFLSFILQFELHRSLCKAAGHEGPLHTCSIYNNKAAGQKLWSMMQLGSSKPWPQALELVTGKTDMDATAIREYFQPLEKWLIEKNKGQKCGW